MDQYHNATIFTGPEGSGKMQAAKDLLTGEKIQTFTEAQFLSNEWETFLKNDTQAIIVIGEGNITGIDVIAFVERRDLGKPYAIFIQQQMNLRNCENSAKIYHLEFPIDFGETFTDIEENN